MSTPNTMPDIQLCAKCGARTRGLHDATPYCYKHNPATFEARKARRNTWLETEQGLKSRRKASLDYYYRKKAQMLIEQQTA